MNDDVVDGWFKFLADCRRDSGYPHSQQASLNMGALTERWEKECPGLEVPSAVWSNAEGRYVLTNLNVSKKF